MVPETSSKDCWAIFSDGKVRYLSFRGERLIVTKSKNVSDKMTKVNLPASSQKMKNLGEAQQQNKRGSSQRRGNKRKFYILII